MSDNISDAIAAGTDTTAAAISDLCGKAAKELRQLETKKEEIIQNLAKEVEQRGVPRNKVARIVVKELTSRGAASPDYIYECLGIEQKEQKKSHIKKKDIEESAKVSEQIFNEQSPRKEILVSAGGSQIQEQSSEPKPQLKLTADQLKDEKAIQGEIHGQNRLEQDKNRLEQENKELIEQLKLQKKQQQDQDQEPRQQKINRYKKIIQNFVESKFADGY